MKFNNSDVVIDHNSSIRLQWTGKYMNEPKLSIDNHHFDDDLKTEVYLFVFTYKTKYNDSKTLYANLRYSKIRRFYEYIDKCFPDVIKTINCSFPPKRYFFYTYEGVAKERFEMLRLFFKRLSLFPFLFETEQFTSLFTDE